MGDDFHVEALALEDADANADDRNPFVTRNENDAILCVIMVRTMA